jgi:hypothetical protein
LVGLQQRKSSQPPTPLPPSSQQEPGDSRGTSRSCTKQQPAEKSQQNSQQEKEEVEDGEWLSDNQRLQLAVQVQVTEQI